MPKILVTGGSGFIGSHLVDNLIENGYDVVNFSRSSYPANESCEWFRGDILNIGDLERSIAGIDGIVHLAAVSRIKDGYEDPLKCMKTNIMGTINIFEAIKNSPQKPWVICGSTLESDWHTDDCFTGTFKIPTSFYGLTKFVNELSAIQYVRDHNLRIMTLRIGYVYGSLRDQLEKALPTFVSQSLNGEDLNVLTDSPQCFIYYEDLMAGIVAGISYMERLDQRGRFYGIFTIAPDQKTSLKDLANLIIDECRSQSRVVLNIANGGKLKYEIYNGEETVEALKFIPGVSLRSGIRRFADELRKNL